MNKELQRYFEVARKLRSGQEVPKGDISFFLEYSPNVDQTVLQKMVDAGEAATPEEASAALIESGRALQSSPQYKDQTLSLAKDAEKGKLSDQLAQGIGLILGASDIGQSIAQIQASKKGLAGSRRPARPAIPQRDTQLANALRQSQESTNDAGRALAPSQAQIQDQYQNDLANARIASTGQAGAYGAYSQLAANRRNRSAMELVPIQDQIRREQQGRQDQLLGMRMQENQNMFDNQQQLYGQDLQQYNQDQQAYGQLGATGRSNLRNSLYGLGQQLAPAVADMYTKRKYRNLRNQAMAAYGPEFANTVIQANKNLDGYYGTMTPDDTPEYWK